MKVATRKSCNSSVMLHIRWNCLNWRVPLLCLLHLFIVCALCLWRWTGKIFYNSRVDAKLVAVDRNGDLKVFTDLKRQSECDWHQAGERCGSFWNPVSSLGCLTPVAKVWFWKISGEESATSVFALLSGLCLFLYKQEDLIVRFCRPQKNEWRNWSPFMGLCTDC